MKVIHLLSLIFLASCITVVHNTYELEENLMGYLNSIHINLDSQLIEEWQDICINILDFNVQDLDTIFFKNGLALGPHAFEVTELAVGVFGTDIRKGIGIRFHDDVIIKEEKK